MKKLFVFLMVAGLVIVGSGVASAGLLFDRGLPTANLNNAAGANRSNVAWADDSPVLEGDDFTIGGSGDYFVEKIRIWSVVNQNVSVWFGQAGGLFTEFQLNPTLVTYADASLSTYQGSSGADRDLWQLEFDLNTVLNGATTYQFFLDGGGEVYAYLHSSNAALSGSTQQGANDLMLSASLLNGTLSNVASWTSNAQGVWDKASDANVQVFGTPVPEPTTMLLLGFGLVGLAALRRKSRS